MTRVGVGVSIWKAVFILGLRVRGLAIRDERHGLASLELEDPVYAEATCSHDKSGVDPRFERLCLLTVDNIRRILRAMALYDQDSDLEATVYHPQPLDEVQQTFMRHFVGDKLGRLAAVQRGERRAGRCG